MRPCPAPILFRLCLFALALNRVSLADEPTGAPHPSGIVTILSTPDGGIQPQAVIGPDGTIHLLFFEGRPAAGDLFYVRRKPGQSDFTKPVRVNSQAGSSIAVGTIRGGQIALGPGGQAHVAWNGSEAARPRNPFGGSPLLYTRSNQDGTTFEPQRNLMRRTSALDGGGTVAAGPDGLVIVAWHGRSEDAPPGEIGRRLWVTRSTDGGANFADEVPALERRTGACACCGTRALVDHDGTASILYRAAEQNVHRDMILLTARHGGEHFQGKLLHSWTINACPMSSASLADTRLATLAAWETGGQVYYSQISPTSGAIPSPIHPPGDGGNRKHPAVAGNAKGETILVWAEDTGWQRGGSLAWQVFDPAGRPTEETGRIEDGVPVWSLPTVVADPDGTFTIVH